LPAARAAIAAGPSDGAEIEHRRGLDEFVANERVTPAPAEGALRFAHHVRKAGTGGQVRQDMPPTLDHYLELPSMEGLEAAHTLGLDAILAAR
jgi:hypothetical protein